MIRVGLPLTALFLLLVASACSQPRSDDAAMPKNSPSSVQADDGDESETVVPADQIPDVVRRAALAEVPGLVIELAELEGESGARIYCVHGRVDGKFCEVEVAADGSSAHLEDDDGDDDAFGGSEDDDDR